MVKLGGSLITDKRRRETPRRDIIRRLAGEVAAALEQRPGLRLVLGHGSGSYGHYAAADYGVHEGHLRDWYGYAATAAAAQRLNRLVTDALLAEGVAAVSVQPSASAHSRDGSLEYLDISPVQELVRRGAVPLLYGDVALDSVWGCTIISTEQILAYVARRMRPARLIVATRVEGVYTADPQIDADARLIPMIRAADYCGVERMLSAAFDVDVTGGMASKVRILVDLVRERPELTVRVISGEREGLLQRVLVDPVVTEGTTIAA